MIELKLPALGADMDEGKLLEWRIKPGDAVKKGDIVAVVDTAKAAIDVESWQEGFVFELAVAPETTIPVGALMAYLLEPGETVAQAQEWKRAHPPQAVTVAHAPAVVAAEPVGPARAPAARRRISPAARKRAEELAVNMDAVAGSGPDGAVTVADVEKAVAARTAGEKPAPPTERASAMRQVIAAAMARSKREIPHYYLTEEVPLRRLTSWLAQYNEQRPVTERLLVAPALLKAVALALKKYPELNGFWKTAGFVPGAGIHMGVAISLRQGGLIAPAIHDAEQKDLPTLMRALTDLVQRARAGSLRSSEIADATVTVTNLGDQGVATVLGVIYPPQVALVGFGRVAPRPWVVDGELRAVPIVTASLAADHRVSDGHRGAMFLATVRDLLQHPEQL